MILVQLSNYKYCPQINAALEISTTFEALKFNKNTLTAAFSHTCLVIRSRNEEAIIILHKTGFTR